MDLLDKVGKWLGGSFDMQRFARRLVRNKARRWIRERFDHYGGLKVVLFLIHSNKSLLDYLTPEERARYRQQYRLPPQITEAFTDEDMLTWLPPEYECILQQPGGREWVLRQIKEVRSQVLSTT